MADLRCWDFDCKERDERGKCKCTGWNNASGTLPPRATNVEELQPSFDGNTARYGSNMCQTRYDANAHQSRYNANTHHNVYNANVCYNRYNRYSANMCQNRYDANNMCHDNNHDNNGYYDGHIIEWLKTKIGFDSERQKLKQDLSSLHNELVDNFEYIRHLIETELGITYIDNSQSLAFTNQGSSDFKQIRNNILNSLRQGTDETGKYNFLALSRDFKYRLLKLQDSLQEYYIKRYLPKAYHHYKFSDLPSHLKIEIKLVDDLMVSFEKCDVIVSKIERIADDLYNYIMEFMPRRIVPRP